MSSTAIGRVGSHRLECVGERRPPRDTAFGIEPGRPLISESLRDRRSIGVVHYTGTAVPWRADRRTSEVSGEFIRIQKIQKIQKMREIKDEAG